MQNTSVIFSLDAENDLRRIADYLFENDFDLEKVDKIRHKITQMLSDYPMSGAIYDEKLNIRKILILKLNSVYYSINGKTVNILHVRAGKMSKEI
jgi:plasmid stabilization system protein ParE